MWTFYLIALLPVLIGAGMWIAKKEVVWWEWLIGTGVSFGIAGFIHLLVASGMTNDTETWSGQVMSVIFYPEWVEQYEVAVYKTETYTIDKQTYTRQVFSHYETRYRTHREHWEAGLYFGAESNDRNINKAKYLQIKKDFGDKIDKKKSHKSGFYKGDPYIYITKNTTGYIHPVFKLKKFENKVKCAPSIFSYIEVPKDVKVFEYPKNEGKWKSDRVLGTAKNIISIYNWDCLNAKLGPRKKLNLILIGFPLGESTMISQYQEAKYIGGKKNDLVLCYAGDYKKPDWAYVFGWSENEKVKRDLETLILSGISKDFCNKVERTVYDGNYVKKEWSKFDYISISPPMWGYWTLIGVMILTQGIFWFWANKNEFQRSEI